MYDNVTIRTGLTIIKEPQPMYFLDLGGIVIVEPPKKPKMITVILHDN